MLSGTAPSECLELLREYDAGHPGVLPAEFLEDDVDVGVNFAQALIEAAELNPAKADPVSKPVTQDLTESANAESLGAPCVLAASAVQNSRDIIRRRQSRRSSRVLSRAFGGCHGSYGG